MECAICGVRAPPRRIGPSPTTLECVQDRPPHRASMFQAPFPFVPPYPFERTVQSVRQRDGIEREWRTPSKEPDPATRHVIQGRGAELARVNRGLVPHPRARLKVDIEPNFCDPDAPVRFFI